MTSRWNSLEFIEPSSINKVSLVYVSSCSNTGPITARPITSRKRSLELIEPSSINKVSFVYISSCSNTGPITAGPITSRKRSLELIDLPRPLFVMPLVGETL